MFQNGPKESTIATRYLQEFNGIDNFDANNLLYFKYFLNNIKMYKSYTLLLIIYLMRSFDYFFLAYWWRMYGGEMPNLCKMAIKILNKISTSFNCERNWSAFKRVSI